MYIHIHIHSSFLDLYMHIYEMKKSKTYVGNMVRALKRRRIVYGPLHACVCEVVCVILLFWQ